MIENEIIRCDVLDGFSHLEDDSIDLIVTSPPYNCGIPYDSWNDSLEWREYLSWCSQWISESRRVLKPDGRFACNVLVEMGICENKIRVSPQVEFYKLFQENGLNIMAQPLWVDPTKSTLTAWGSWMSASAPYIYNPSEVILIGFKEFSKKQSKGISSCSKEDFIRGVSGIWNIQPETSGLTIANFPCELSRLCIEILSYRNDLVLDPFMGSGTTAVSAKQTGRRYLGFEISENYVEIARQRIHGVSANTKEDPMKRVLRNISKKENHLSDFLE